MSFKPIYVDRQENSYDHVGGMIVYLCESDSDISNLPDGTPTVEKTTAIPLPGSIAIIPNPKKIYVLQVNNTWVAVE